MVKKLLFVVLIVSNFAYSQNTVGTISITEDAYEGYTLFTTHLKSYLINNCGELINEWTSTYLPGNSVYLLPNGNLLRAGRITDSMSNINFGGTGGVVELFDWDGNLLWSYIYFSNDFRQHHDVYPLPNGNVLMLAATVINQTDAIQAGRNPLFLPDNEIYNEQILELEPVGTNQANIVWEWNIKDHLIQDLDNTKDNFGVVEDNPQLVDINFFNGLNGANNWLHINSMQYDETLDQIVLSSRHLSEVWVIDHSTTTAEAATNSGGTYGKGGDLLYRWGNPQAYKQGTVNDRKLFGQHYPHFIPSGLPNEGKIILFNNGFQRTPSFSQVDIITPPVVSPGVYQYTPNTAYGPVNSDYTYTDLSSDPSEFYTAILSSAQQLPNGHILVCEGIDGNVFELDASDNKVWEYINPIHNVTGNTTNQGDPPNGSRLFRAIKYPTDYPGFNGRDLTPGIPLEGNPDLTPCNNLSVSDFENSIVNVYPNPTKDIIYVSSINTIDKIEVYNTLGHKIKETHNKYVNLAKQASGIYFLKIYSQNSTISKKILKH
ncbi:hypothetical protein FBALC1_13462 [Flavobacteriales bacterium ALC-1]|nr:hypothetical protein FBALC1_13462 [Flavobacteriales bacterium ALC-1]